MISNPIDWETHPFVFSGFQYAIDVIAGKIPNCVYVIGACERFIKDYNLKYYPFNTDKAERYLRTTQIFSHVKGKNWKTEHIQYEPWQNFMFMNIMGFLHPITGERRFRVVHSEIPRGNGKSLLASQAALFFLALDEPKGNEISCIATKTEQARIVLDSARAMAKSNPKFLKATGVEVLAHKIVHEKSNSFIRALSSDSKSLDGLNDILCLMDELHAVTRELYEVIYSGMKKRNDSLLLSITTAGFSNDGIGYSESQYAKKVCKGEVQDDQFFAIVYTIDEGDDIFIEETWKKANPNYGVSVDPITFGATAAKAKVMPSDVANFKVKNLNVWLSESRAYYDLEKWDACANTELKISDFYNKKCFVGIDLASKIDLTAFVFLFRENGTYYIFDKAFIPQKTVEEVRSPLYDDAIANGFLIATPGEAINYPKLEETFLSLTSKIKILSAHYDPWASTSFAQNLEKKNVNMVEFRQNVANFSEATKTLDALIRQRKIVHNGSPLTRFCIGNVVCKEDAAGNVYPRKSHERLKIDITIAILMALAGWINEKETEKAYSNSAGIRYI
jgi:phage terminase large subunit-like protein